MPSLRTGRPRQGAGVAAMDQLSAQARQSPPSIPRTAEVLYLLSRGAQLEHPHMIIVHYAAHQPGPTLKDVKARLVALRGKGMPDSFSWSYKRKYKDTFIWCDLFDDDLIHPCPGSDEYMLKAVKLFDMVNVAPSQDGEAALEHEELPLPTRTSSPCTKPSSRHLASKPEHLHVENDVSLAIKKSLLLINIPQPADIMSNLKGGGGEAPEVCSVEHSNISSSRTFQGTPPGSSGARTGRSQTGTTTTTNAASQTAYRELHKDVTTDCNLGMSKKDETTSVSPRHTRRKMWEKESSSVYTATNLEENSNSGPDDPFLYGVLRKATKFGSSFRPRLCRGVDVIDATRTKTKLLYRSKAKELEEPTCEESVTHVSESKPLLEFTGLTEYFDFKDLRASPNSPVILDKRVNIEEIATDSQPRRPFGNEALDASYRKTMEVLAKLPNSRGASRVHTHDHVPQDDQRSFRSDSKGNKQEVMKLESTNSKSVKNSKPSRDSHDEFLHHPCSTHGMPEEDDAPVQVVEERDRHVKQRSSRPVVKKPTMAGFEASTVSCRAKATVKTPEEKRIKGSRNNVSKVEDSTKPQRSEMDFRPMHNGNKQGLKSMEPATNGLVECTTPATAAVEAVVTSKHNHPNEAGAKQWPFEPPARPRDFKSREDRPLVPGLTTMDWEKSLQEACMHSEPPANLVLQECSRCGRTFKPESLQVHMRGCRGDKKPKPVSQRRASL